MEDIKWKYINGQVLWPTGSSLQIFTRTQRHYRPTKNKWILYNWFVKWEMRVPICFLLIVLLFLYTTSCSDDEWGWMSRSVFRILK